MSAIGPDFISLQVRNLERSAAFYEQHLGLDRAEVSPPHAVVFATQPIPFAVREPLPGVDELMGRLRGGGHHDDYNEVTRCGTARSPRLRGERVTPAPASRDRWQGPRIP